MNITTWRHLISEKMSLRGDDWANVVSCTLSDAGLDKEFDAGFGSEEGEPFTVWTETTVYFPLVFDGGEFVGSVSRHPDGKPTPHQGY